MSEVLIDHLALLIVRGDTARMDEGRRLALDMLRPAVRTVVEFMDSTGGRNLIYTSAFYDARRRTRVQYHRKSRGHR